MANPVRTLTPAYAACLRCPPSPTAVTQISQLSDSRVEKLEKAFKRGQKVRARVIGHRLMDGLASLTLKPSVLDQAYLSFEEIRRARKEPVVENRVTSHLSGVSPRLRR